MCCHVFYISLIILESLYAIFLRQGITGRY
jgi:hypothetical protein